MDQSYLLIFENFEDILAKKIVLNDALYEAMEVARVFPKQYLDTLKVCQSQWFISFHISFIHEAAGDG